MAATGPGGHGGGMSSARANPPIRVRSVPAGHDYVRHAIGSARDELVVLADPILDPAEPDRWWPHPVLEAAERPDVLDGADVVHVHFGYEHRSPAQIAAFVSAVRSRGLSLVVTVHDLTNPHEPDEAAHLERTGHLVTGADTVITLTQGAAAEIRRRWGVDPLVIPHPRLMPPQVTEPHRRRRRGQAGRTAGTGRTLDSGATVGTDRTVGVVLGSLRAGVAAEELLAPLVDALPEGCGLVVMVRADALAAARAPDHPRHAAALELDRMASQSDAGGRVEVRAHGHLSESDLCAFLAGFDALVLPHRHGTHSGWLELCRDLGLPPVIPRIGFLTEQWGLEDPGTYDPSNPTPEVLRDALRRALDSPPLEPRDPASEDAAVAAAHVEIYRSALNSPCDAPSP